MPVSVGLISLGCPKNLIDSEIMAGHLRNAGMVMTPEQDLADVVVINTCAFIDKAKQESIDTILGAARARENGEAPKNQKLIVAGCMSQRFSKELPDLLPEVDAFIGVDQVTKIAEVIEGVIHGTAEGKNYVTRKPTYVPEWDTPRYRLTPRHSAYVKIAEGCNHACSYCAIPLIRGPHRSRSQESVVREVKMLVESGVKEINLIAQDTTYFGMDRWKGEKATKRSGVDSSKGESLASLIRELDKIEGDFWIRILYTHPAHWSDELTQAIAESSKVVRYIDIPLQHISDRMLADMRRLTDGRYVRDVIRRMREGIPGLALRTTFITGFPGETEEDHQELMEFIEEFRFERAGIFTYSREEGTLAYRMKPQVHHRTKARRWNEASLLMTRIASEIGQAQIGKTLRVLVEAPGVARSEWDAPDIDGSVMVDPSLPVGEFADVKIVDAVAYDLFAEGSVIPEAEETDAVE